MLSQQPSRLGRAVGDLDAKATRRLSLMSGSARDRPAAAPDRHILDNTDKKEPSDEQGQKYICMFPSNKQNWGGGGLGTCSSVNLKSFSQAV